MIIKTTKAEAKAWAKKRKLLSKNAKRDFYYFEIKGTWYKCNTPGAAGLNEIWKFRMAKKAEENSNTSLFEQEQKDNTNEQG